MADPLRLITSPLPVAAGLGFADLSAAVAADALARRSWAAGRPASVVFQSAAGDLGGVIAFDRDLVRQGLDRDALTPDELTEYARAFAASCRSSAANRLEALGVTSDLDETMTTNDIAAAATVAFVRLYDQGLIDLSGVVVPHCPSCRTVIEGPDAVAGDVEADVLRVRLRIRPGRELEVRCTASELIDGAVAIAVPVGHPAAGATATLPLSRRLVPVLAEPGCVEPRFLVPAHDVSAHEVCQLHGLTAISVLSSDAVVTIDGPLRDLPRFAARQAATALLDAEGVIIDTEPGVENVDRCRQCGSVAVCVLAMHWLLHVADLEVAAADAIRHALVAFVPSDARDLVLENAGGPPWCLDRSIPGGIPLPVAICRDCEQVSVEVELPSMCGKCFGEVDHSTRTLDARFVAALAPLVRAGWPRRISSDQVAASRATFAVLPPDAIASWALPALALGLHLAGLVPFGTVVVQPPQGVPDGVEITEEDTDPRVARLALLAAIDPDAAQVAVEGLDADAADDDGAVLAAVDAAVAALDEGGPARAAALLVAALTGGVPTTAADRVRALVVPFLGA